MEDGETAYLEAGADMTAIDRFDRRIARHDVSIGLAATNALFVSGGSHRGPLCDLFGELVDVRPVFALVLHGDEDDVIPINLGSPAM